jgi:Phage portal protein
MTLTDALRAEHRKALALPASAGRSSARDVAAVAQQLVQQGWPQTTADAIALPRQEGQFMGSFGPSVPATATPMDVPRGGLVLPRRSQYPVGYNLPSPPGAYKLIDFGTLRSLARIYDIGRRCIELRKGEVSNMDWEVSFKDPDRAKAQKTQARSRARAAASGRTIATQELGEDDVAIQELTAWWDDPDPIRQLGFDGWTALLVENVLVIDAPAIFAHPTWMPGRGRLGSDLYALEVLAGDTIKPLIDVRGAPPMPPNPAYQQFIWGIPRTELQQDLLDAATRPLGSPPDGLAGEYQMPSSQPLGVVGGESGAPQLYYPVYYPQDDSLYGFSNTEQIILTVNLALKRQQWWTAFFTDGTVPAGLLHLPEEWNPSDIREYEETWNSLLSGEMAWKHRVRAIPGSTGFTQLKPVIGTDAGITAFDEWLARLTCVGYDVTPDELGLSPKGGLGGAGYSAAQENVTYRKSLKPLTNWLEKIVRRVNARHFRRPDLVLRFMYEEAEDQLSRAQADSMLIDKGVKTQDEARQDRGLDPYEGGIGSKPMIVTRAGALLLRDVDAMSTGLAKPTAPGVAMQPPKAQPLGEPPPPGGGPVVGSTGRPAREGEAPAQGGEANAEPPSRTAASKALALWQTQALRRLRGGRQALDPPRGAEVPSELALALRERLSKAATPDEIRAAFADFLQTAAA